MNEEGNNNADNFKMPDEILLELRRGRSKFSRELMAHTVAMRGASLALCDHLCNFALADDEHEAKELYANVQAAWGMVKASYRLVDIAISGA